jgi:hypothetical protein
MTEHVIITDPNIHEPKGVASAVAGAVYVADGLGGGVWTTHLAGTVQQGIYDYHDAATAITPIALTLADTEYELTNDGAGPQTYTSPLTGLTEMWNTTTNRIVFTSGDVLSVGDTVDFRLDVIADTASINTSITIEMELDVDGVPFRLALIPSTNFKDVGLHTQIRYTGIYMGSEATLNGVGRILASADSTGVTIQVNGWYFRALHSA